MVGRAYIAACAKHDTAELVDVLHHLYAVAIDRGGQTEEEAQVVFDRAKLLLSEHGVEV